MALDGLAEPSNRKALQGIEGFYRGKQYGDGKPMRPSPRKVEGMDFAAMSSVAHLRAASEVVRAIYGKDEAKARMHNARGVKRFLRFAAYFQRYGLQSLTPRTNKRRVHPMLDANRLWYVPSNIQPIEASQLPAAKPEMRKLLDSYSHT
jgi:hypothetical protein